MRHLRRHIVGATAAAALATAFAGALIHAEPRAAEPWLVVLVAATIGVAMHRGG